MGKKTRTHARTHTRTHTAKKAKEDGMTIPELRKAFEHIDHFTQTEKGQKVEEFRKEWRKVFGKDVSEHAARDYLAFVSKAKPVQSGGMAPLDYTTRAGTDIPYGNFPAYVSGGFGFANADSFTAVAGKEDITPVIPAGLGSNLVNGGGRKRQTRKKQKGGGLLPSLAEALTRPFGMNSPPSAAQLAQMSVKGVEAGADPRPEIPVFKVSGSSPVVGM